MHIRKKYVSTKDLRVCANNPKLEDFIIQNHYNEFLRMYAKQIHVSIKVWSICQRTKSKNNGAQNTSTYLKGSIQIAIN